MELDELPAFSKALLEEEKKVPATVPAETLERVLGRVEQTVGLAAPAAAASVLGAKALSLALAALAVGAGGAWVLRAPAVPAPIVIVQTVKVEVPVRVEVPVVIAPAPAPAPTAAQKPVLVAPNKSLELEQAQLDVARAALVQSRAAAALEALASHRRQFPKGQLAEERDALEVQALWKAGRDADARAKGAAFRKAHPDSIFGPVIDALEQSP